jgi:hypothetical protein
MIDAAVKAGLGTREEIVANIEATRPGTARVATTLGQTGVTSAAKATPATVSEAATTAAKVSYDNLSAFQKDMVDSVAPKTLDQTAADILGIEIDAKSKDRALTPAEQSMVNNAVTRDLMTPRDARLSTDEITFRDIESRTAPTAAQRAEAARIDREERGIFDDDIAREAAREAARIDREERGIFDDDAMSTAQAQAEAGRAREARGQTRTESFESRQDYKDNVSSYESRGYSSSAAREAGANKTRADDEAMNQTGDYSGRTSAVTDSNGNAVRTGSGGVVTNTSPDDSGSSSNDKIICTAMNNAYGFGSFRQTVWLQHSKNMHPAYQKGYHRIFKPLIKVAYKDEKWYNIALRKTLEGIARRRTADIWMQKHGKRHFLGAIERAILEPICYIVGKIK